MTGQKVNANTNKTHVIDGKYEVIREVSRHQNMRLYDVRTGSGANRRVAWFEIASQSDRQAFYTYRTALRAVSPAGLTDVVTRPGAHYVVWQVLNGLPLQAWADQTSKQREILDALNSLAADIAKHGFALADADIVLTENAPRIAYLRPAPPTRTPKEVIEQNTEILKKLGGGYATPPPHTEQTAKGRQTKQSKQSGQSKKQAKRKQERPANTLWTFLPGVLFIGGTVWFALQASELYLNPPMTKVTDMVGRNALNAARQLSKSGFKVEFSYAESGALPVGAVIRQLPEGGKSMPVGRLITLTVNRPTLLTVPRLEDLNIKQTKTPLQESRLKIGQVIKADGTVSNTPAGRIMAQYPSAGMNVQRGEKIRVVVSTGIRGQDTWISNLKGMTFDQARDNARAAGLVVTEIRRETSDEVENIVLKQEPAPFERVEVGSPVKLTISKARYSAPVTSAGPLPIPPKYIPPPPPEPEDPYAEEGAGQAQQQPYQQQQQSQQSQYPQETQQAQQAQQQAPAPSAQTAAPPAPAAPPPPTPTPPTAASTRPVRFMYTFPKNIPAGTYTISVIDNGGERVIMRAEATQIAGLLAQSTERVAGNAVFVIRVNGAEFARVEPR